jgi:hypothetical protein
LPSSGIQAWSLDIYNTTGCDGAPTLGGHFNGAHPFVVDGKLKLFGDVTISRLWRCDGRYQWIAFEGRSGPPHRTFTGDNLRWSKIDSGKAPERFDSLIHAYLPHPRDSVLRPPRKTHSGGFSVTPY